MNAHQAFSEFLTGLAKVEQPKFTRILTREEIAALSHADFLEWCAWIQANSERLTAERRAMGNQDEFLSLDRDYDKPTSLRNWEYGE